MPSLPLVIRRILGRNGVDPPQELPEDMATEVLEMDFADGSIGRKRGGAANVTLNGFTAGGRAACLFRYLPGDDETVAELHAFETGALSTGQRLTGGTTWATYTLADAIQAPVQDASMVSFNGKFFQAYNSAVNRLHVYPSAGGTHRRVGFEVAPAAPSVSEAGGSVTDNRKYAVCWTEQVSGTTVRRSNLGALTAVRTLTAEDATLTRPTAPGDGETHWEVYAYQDDDNYAAGHLLSTIVLATTTYVDNNTGTLSGAAPPTAGANTPPPSAKYLLTDGTHLLGAGAWETSAGTSLTPSSRMIWWTPALGTTATDGDDERISNTTDNKSYLYVDQGLTGIGGPLHGVIYAFSYRQIYKLIPTGQATAAYERVTVRTDIGCIRHHTICLGEDEQGRPALYWLSHRGPMRASVEGIQYLGRDIEDRWALVNQEATNAVGWGLYVPERQQVWWFVSVSGNNDPNEKLVFDCRLGRVTEFRNVITVRYGWSRATGISTEARAGCLFSNTLGSAMSRDLKPYVCRVGTGISNPTIWKLDSGTQDVSTNYQAYMKSKAYTLQAGQNLGMIEDAHVIAKTSAGVTLTLTIDRDFGAETTTATASIAAAASETRTQAKLEGAAVSQAGFVQFQIGDGSAVNNTWTVDALVTPLILEDKR